MIKWFKWPGLLVTAASGFLFQVSPIAGFMVGLAGMCVWQLAEQAEVWDRAAWYREHMFEARRKLIELGTHESVTWVLSEPFRPEDDLDA